MPPRGSPSQNERDSCNNEHTQGVKNDEAVNKIWAWIRLSDEDRLD